MVAGGLAVRDKKRRYPNGKLALASLLVISNPGRSNAMQQEPRAVSRQSQKYITLATKRAVQFLGGGDGGKRAW
jgi:hypothetical protein